MTKLEQEILANGCGDLAALQWCKEARVTLQFWADGTVSVIDDRGGAVHGSNTLPAAVVQYLKVEAETRSVKP